MSTKLTKPVEREVTIAGIDKPVLVTFAPGGVSARGQGKQNNSRDEPDPSTGEHGHTAGCSESPVRQAVGVAEGQRPQVTRAIPVAVITAVEQSFLQSSLRISSRLS